jgi:arylsulfatase A-like enzyme
MGQPGSYFGTDNFGNDAEGRPKREVPGLELYHGQDIFLTEALTLEMNMAIEGAVRDRKPFFAYMSHYAAHAPFQTDPRFRDHYSNETQALAAYGTLIEGMDKSLGDLLDQLERLGIAENTLVFFVGDNGTDSPRGDELAISAAAPLREKRNALRRRMRVPFIAAGQAIP